MAMLAGSVTVAVSVLCGVPCLPWSYLAFSGARDVVQETIARDYRGHGQNISLQLFRCVYATHVALNIGGALASRAGAHCQSEVVALQRFQSYQKLGYPREASLA